MKLLWLCNSAPGVVRAQISGKPAGGVNWVDHVLSGLRGAGMQLCYLPGGAALCLFPGNGRTVPAGTPAVSAGCDPQLGYGVCPHPCNGECSGAGRDASQTGSQHSGPLFCIHRPLCGRRSLSCTAKQYLPGPDPQRQYCAAAEKVFPPEHFGDLPSQNSMIIYFKGKYVECKKLNCYRR